MVARDHADSTRADSPLTDDGTYVRVDTSALTADEVVAAVLAGRPKGLTGPPVDRFRAGRLTSRVPVA